MIEHDFNGLFKMTEDTQDSPLIQEPRLWQNEQWTAQVIKNDDDDGWAVAMFKTGESEPAHGGCAEANHVGAEAADLRGAL